MVYLSVSFLNSTSIMDLVTSSLDNIPFIISIIEDAKKHLANQKIDQWQNGYPNEAQIINDIHNQESYVVKNKEGEIVATAMFTTKRDATYQSIDGKWQLDETAPYGVVHRLAIKNGYRKLGISSFIFKQFHEKLLSAKIQSLKIDTHEDNTEMRHLLTTLGYQFCGIIYTSYGAKRLAFEKIIF